MPSSSTSRTPSRPAAKAAARGALIESELDPDRVIVRVNPPGTDDFVADLATLSQTDYRTIMVAKAESVKQLEQHRPAVLGHRAVRDRARAWRTRRSSPRTTEVGRADVGRRGPRREPRRHVEPQAQRPLPRRRARTPARAVLLAAGARGKAAIDAVHLDIADTKRLAIEAADAAASGFAATACIHPQPGRGHPRARTGPDARRGRVGARGARCRPRPSAASSRTRAAWSTSRCCATRARWSRAPTGTRIRRSRRTGRPDLLRDLRRRASHRGHSCP